MAIGLKFGRMESDQVDNKTRTHDKVDMLMSKFEDQFSAVKCFDLIGCDFRTPAGNERFKSGNLITECRKFVAFVAGVALTLLE